MLVLHDAEGVGPASDMSSGYGSWIPLNESGLKGQSRPRLPASMGFMGGTTLNLCLLDTMEVGQATKEEILRNLQPDSDEIAKLRRESPPVAVLRVSHLREVSPEGRIPRGTGQGMLTQSTGHRAIEAREMTYEELARRPLFDFSRFGRVDVVRIGRHPDQDLQLLDSLVSREHGLVLCHAGRILYCDYGTLLPEGGREGSSNGTHLNGVVGIRDRMILWEERQSLTLGASFGSQGGLLAFAFKLDYQLVPEDAAARSS
jgi:hypothetical protein